MVVFMLQRQSWVVMTETVWPTKPKICNIWLSTERVCWVLVQIQVSVWSHIPSAWITSFNSYCSTKSPGNGFSQLFMYLKVFPLFLKTIFNGYIILGWQIFFILISQRLLFHHLLAHRVYSEKSAIVYSLLLCMCFFLPLASFRIFYFWFSVVWI